MQSGFNHQSLYIIPLDKPKEIIPATWGLVGSNVSYSSAEFYKSYNTLNARSETAFVSQLYKILF